MKKILLAIVAITALTSTACAQGVNKKEMNDEQMLTRRLERMTERLDLNATQQAQMKAIMEETGKQLKDIEAQKRAIMDAQKAKMDKILTAEQQQKMKEMREHKHGRHGKGGFKGEKRGRHDCGDFKGGKRGPRGDFGGRDFKDFDNAEE